MARAKQADEEIDLDPTAQAETTAVEPSDVADMPTPTPTPVWMQNSRLSISPGSSPPSSVSKTGVNHGSYASP